jgi:REP element-mobilizing transposase RayT
MPGHASLRKGRTSAAGQIYLVTFTTAARARLFEDHNVARLAAQAMTDRRLWYRSQLLAWVLMPDHWHGLIELGAMDSLSIIVQKLKINSARRMRTEYPATGAVWEKGFHDRAIRTESIIKPAARYIVSNPLRAGLADHPGEYPYWNSVWL